MTFERKIMVGLDDIRAIAFQCKQCEYRVTMSPDNLSGITVPQHCPNGHDWNNGVNEALVIPPILLFTSMLAKLRVLLKQGALGFTILFEFDEPQVRL
jgi:hypothetical protein